MAEKRSSRRPELQAAWREEARPELSWAVMEPRSVNQCRRAGRRGEGGAVGGVLGGGDIPGRENGMCKGEARRLRGGKQISKAQE